MSGRNRVWTWANGPRLRELERKYREVKLENEFLKKAAA